MATIPITSIKVLSLHLMKFKRVAIHILAVVLFLSYYGGSTLFNHTHHYDWGDVTHSHPYAPSSSHTHSTASLFTISVLTTLLFIVGAAFALQGLFAFSHRFVEIAVKHIAYSHGRYCSLRAPPALLN